MSTRPATGSAREERRLVTGSLWLGAAQVVVSLGTLGSGVLAARVLSKHDIGLMGIALLATSMLDQLSQSGFDKALVQREKSVEEYLNVGWTWNTLRGLTLMLILCAIAYPLSHWYDEPSLLPIVAVTSSYALLTGMQNVGTVFFSRELDFRKLFLIRGVQAAATLGISIPAIMILRNVWALVIGTVSGALAFLTVSYIYHPYRPRFEWNRRKLGHLLTYGKWLTATNALVFIVTQGDDLFLSKYLGPVALAVYQLAYQIGNLPATHVTHVIGQSSFPTYARLQGDLARLRAAFTSVMRGVLVFSGSVSVFLALTVPYIVAHVVGEKWRPIIPLVQILLLAGFLRSFLALAGPLFQAVGRTDLDFRMNVPRGVVLVLLIYPAVAYGGLAGACWLVFASLAVILPWWFSGVRAILGLRIREVLGANLLCLVSAAILALVLWSLRWRLGYGLGAMFVVGIGGVGAWLGLLYLLGRLVPGLSFFGEIARLRDTIRAPSVGLGPQGTGEPRSELVRAPSE